MLASGHQLSSHLEYCIYRWEMYLESSLEIEADPDECPFRFHFTASSCSSNAEYGCELAQCVEAELTIRATTESPIEFDVTHGTK